MFMSGKQIFSFLKLGALCVVLGGCATVQKFEAKSVAKDAANLSDARHILVVTLPEASDSKDPFFPALIKAHKDELKFRGYSEPKIPMISIVQKGLYSSNTVGEISALPKFTTADELQKWLGDGHLSTADGKKPIDLDAVLLIEVSQTAGGPGMMDKLTGDGSVPFMGKGSATKENQEYSVRITLFDNHGKVAANMVDPVDKNSADKYLDEQARLASHRNPAQGSAAEDAVAQGAHNMQDVFRKAGTATSGMWAGPVANHEWHSTISNVLNKKKSMTPY